jgi:hypothetical protein
MAMSKSKSARGLRHSRATSDGLARLKAEGIPHYRKDRLPGQEGALVDGTPTRYQRLRAVYFAKLRQRQLKPLGTPHTIRLADE